MVEFCRAHRFGLLLVLGVLGIPSNAPGQCIRSCPVSAKSVAELSPCELEALFRQSTVGCPPLGLGRGTVLYVLDAKRPQTRAALQNVAWKGKVFRADGSVFNQWLAVQAVEGRTWLGASWLDGGPCVVIEYPPDAAFFGNSRDELREVAPGLYLGRFYERRPCGRFRGYFVLDFDKK